jgi:hypothetical protein
MIKDRHLHDSVGAEADYQAAIDAGVKNSEWARRLEVVRSRNAIKRARPATTEKQSPLGRVHE